MVTNGVVNVTCYSGRQFLPVCDEGYQLNATSGVQLCAGMTECGQELPLWWAVDFVTGCNVLMKLMLNCTVYMYLTHCGLH